MLSEKHRISVRNLSKSFGSNTVLSNINLNVKEGESFVIMGGSGSGKSVLIKCIMGLLKPDNGSEVFIDGDDVTIIPIIKRAAMLKTFGMLFQGGALFDSLKIWENVTFALMQQGAVSKTQAKQMAQEKLALVGLSERVMYLYPSELSGGMQKRAAIARAITLNPNLIFFDEPTAGLDPIMSQVITELIAKLSKELGAATITITHDIKCARYIADRVAMIHDGGIAWSGTGAELKAPKDPLVSQFVSGSTSGPIKWGS